MQFYRWTLLKRVFSAHLYYHEWCGHCIATNQSKTLLKWPFRSYLYKIANFLRRGSNVLTYAIGVTEIMNLSTNFVL
jgi:hypothetical protein